MKSFRYVFMKRIMDKTLLVILVFLSQAVNSQNVLTERIEYDFWLTEIDSLDNFFPAQKLKVKPKYEKWIEKILSDVQSGKMKAYTWKGNSYTVSYFPFSENKVDSFLYYPFTQSVEIRPKTNDTCYIHDFSGKRLQSFPCFNDSNITQIMKLDATDFGKIRFREKWKFDSTGQVYKYVEAIEFWTWKLTTYGGIEISSYQPVFSIKPNEFLDLTVFDTVTYSVKIITDFSQSLTWYEHNIFPPNRTDWIYKVYDNLNNKKLIAYAKNPKGIFEPTSTLKSYLIDIDTTYSSEDAEAITYTYASIEPENISAITFKEIWKFDTKTGMQKIVLAYAPSRIQIEKVTIFSEEVNNKVGDYEIEDSYEKYIYKFRPLFWLFFK